MLPGAAACSTWPVMRGSPCWRSAEPSQPPCCRLNVPGGGSAAMLTPPFSFDEIMAPLGAERFFAEYEGQRPLHLKGAADKFAAVMNWAQAQRLAGHGYDLVAGLAAAGARQGAGAERALLRGGAGPRRRPGAAARPDKVKSFLKRGATLVANDIDHLSPGLTAFAADDGAGARRQGPGQPLSVVAPPPGLRRALRHPRRLRGARRGHQDLARLRGPRQGPDRAPDVPQR